MKVIIKKNTLGYNANCFNCEKVQDGLKSQPYLVNYKKDGEKRSHNITACSLECANILKERLEQMQ